MKGNRLDDGIGRWEVNLDQANVFARAPGGMVRRPLFTATHKLEIMYSDLEMTRTRRQILLTGAAAATMGVLAPARLRAGPKLELIMFDQVGCPWCARWQKDVGFVYSQTYEGKRAPLRRLDMFGKRPPSLAFIKGIKYSPTFVLIDGKREIGRIIGYPGEAHFYVQLSQLLDKVDKSRTKTAPKS